MFFSKLVVDANILFSFFKKDSTRRLLLEKLLKKRAGINVPYITFSELLNNKDKIVRYSEISPSEFDILISSLRKRLIIFPDKNFEEYIKESLSLAQHFLIFFPLLLVYLHIFYELQNTFHHTLHFLSHPEMGNVQISSLIFLKLFLHYQNHSNIYLAFFYSFFLIFF